jgi:hypothetical protein
MKQDRKNFVYGFHNLIILPIKTELILFLIINFYILYMNTSKITILIIEDEPDIQHLLKYKP